MHKPSKRATKIAAAATTPLAVLVAGGLVWQASYAAFTGQTRNAGNDWSTGSVALTDDDQGSARFTSAGGAQAGCGSFRAPLGHAGDVAAAAHAPGGAVHPGPAPGPPGPQPPGAGGGHQRQSGEHHQRRGGAVGPRGAPADHAQGHLQGVARRGGGAVEDRGQAHRGPHHRHRGAAQDQQCAQDHVLRLEGGRLV